MGYRLIPVTAELVRDALFPSGFRAARTVSTDLPADAVIEDIVRVPVRQGEFLLRMRSAAWEDMPEGGYDIPYFHPTVTVKYPEDDA